jgi:hypothetical protein
MNPTDPNSPAPETKPSPSLTDLCQRSVDYIRHNPVGAVLGALAAGVAVGWLLPHAEPTWRERYVSGPMGKMKGWLQSASEGAADGLHAMQDSASDAASTAATAIGKGVRKLRFW